jgi:PIN domain nuclease of toxin-antitoxin system
VKGYLLDTNAVLFAVGAPGQLSAPATAAIVAGPNFVSVVSLWEVMIKTMKGKLDVGDQRAWWEFALARLDATLLLLHPEHTLQLSSLPLLHKDPFDRILIAQAMV